jgi:ribonuclease-3
MSGLPLDIAELQERIGYVYKNPGYLKTALTHSSYTNELKAKHITAECNERLEFLGDSVLSIVVSKYLYTHFTQYPEGELTKLRASVVCEAALSRFAVKLGLGDFLLLGVGEEKNHGRERKSILADAFEALLASMYLDSDPDGFETVGRFLMPYVLEEARNFGFDERMKDYKSLLQQFIQQTEGDYLTYVTVGESGPDHQKTFTVEARLNSYVIGHGTGQTKRADEQAAAREALKLFGEL